MRKLLKELEGKRMVFIGDFVKVSGKKEHSGAGPAILVRNIKNQAGQLLADHLWIDYCAEVDALQLQEGEQIIFRARVGQYHKGKKGQLVDYKLHHPTKMQRFGQHIFREKRRKRGKAKGDGADANPGSFFLLSA